MIKKILFFIFSLFISPLVSCDRFLPMDEPFSQVSSSNNIYRSCTDSQQYKSMNRDDISLSPKHFDENTLWHTGELKKIDDVFFIEVQKTVRIVDYTPHTTNYTGVIPLLVPVSISLSQAQKIAWHSKHGKSIIALDDKGSLYRIDKIDHGAIGRRPPKIVTVFKKESSIPELNPDFSNVAFNINQNRDRNDLTYTKQRSLCFQTIKKWFKKEEIVIDQSSIEILKNCQENKDSCFLILEHPDTEKKIVFEVTQIVGDPGFLLANKATTGHIEHTPQQSESRDQQPAIPTNIISTIKPDELVQPSSARSSFSPITSEIVDNDRDIIQCYIVEPYEAKGSKHKELYNVIKIYVSKEQFISSNSSLNIKEAIILDKAMVTFYPCEEPGYPVFLKIQQRGENDDEAQEEYHVLLPFQINMHDGMNNGNYDLPLSSIIVAKNQGSEGTIKTLIATIDYKIYVRDYISLGEYQLPNQKNVQVDPPITHIPPLEHKDYRRTMGFRVVEEDTLSAQDLKNPDSSLTGIPQSNPDKVSILPEEKDKTEKKTFNPLIKYLCLTTILGLFIYNFDSIRSQLFNFYEQLLPLFFVQSTQKIALSIDK